MKKSTPLKLSLLSLLVCGIANAGSFPPAPAFGELGAVVIDPYRLSPLTALIGLDSHTVSDVHVMVHGKGKDGVDINYDVSNTSVNTHDGIPVWGLYSDHANKVTVKFKKDGKSFSEDYTIITNAVSNPYIDSRNITALPQVKVTTVDQKFKDRLYLVNSNTYSADGANLNWATPKPIGAKFTDPAPAGGAMPFDMPPLTYVVDTKGEIRWWMNSENFYDGFDIDANKRGSLTGLNLTKQGTYTFVMGQSYGEFDLMGRMTKSRLPRGYIDASHEINQTDKGNYLIRAAKQNYKRADGSYVNTVRDHIIEVTPGGDVVDVWDLNKILDNTREDVLLALDAGAVCMNVDVNAQGKTVEVEQNAPFGDLVGVGAGRNWAHVNSVEYDASDDSIILSVRHQGVVKISRDKQIKWILSPNVGWGKLANKVLTPVDSKGRKLNCNGVRCEGTDFDWSFSQHDAKLSSKGTLTVYDNGGTRGYEQPALKSMKYSRFVEYKINEKKGTVEQVWEYGKERGFAWFSPITSNTEYRADRDTMFGFGGSVNIFKKEGTIGRISEIDYKTKQVKVEIDVINDKAHAPHYRALIVEPNSLFNF
ncbi:aryl-sulfate sulfotransferase [Shewanella youngdeokensis]|uniref:Aryl-sulfate sulfotransferase n=1 Tax=Shewanella youngdeokensis TaxID=2999068 RepID=A0ABZ0K255_9GAMM|nr:aryl-sulfate sulfotransferase [Shewanella sp. DAU334]